MIHVSFMLILIHADSSSFIFIHAHSFFQQTDDPVVWKYQNTVLQNHLQ